MHDSSKGSMKKFAGDYVSAKDKVLDVGSLDINGSYADLFKNYTGLDIVPGKNVAVVAKKPHTWDLKGSAFDVVVSGQAFEHIEFPDKTMKEINRVLKPGGYCCIIAPSAGPPHDHPKDYRRYDEESYRRLCKLVGLIVVELYRNPVGIWKDMVLIARKAKGEK